MMVNKVNSEVWIWNAMIHLQNIITLSKSDVSYFTSKLTEAVARKTRVSSRELLDSAHVLWKICPYIYIFVLKIFYSDSVVKNTILKE